MEKAKKYNMSSHFQLPNSLFIVLCTQCISRIVYIFTIIKLINKKVTLKQYFILTQTLFSFQISIINEEKNIIKFIIKIMETFSHVYKIFI